MVGYDRPVLAEAWRRLDGMRPRILGHRGASARAPENTLRAFALALDEGADGVELDVRLAGTGEVVVFHDADLGRRTGAPGRVRAMPLAELRARDAGAGERVPLLDEALDLALGRGALVNVELKSDDVEGEALALATAALLLRREPAARAHVLVSSFDATLLERFRAHAPELALAYLFDDAHVPRAERERLERALPVSAVHPRASLATVEAVAAWHARGLGVNVWTVDAAAGLARVLSPGVDGIVTNDPRGALSVLAAAVAI